MVNLKLYRYGTNTAVPVRVYHLDRAWRIADRGTIQMIMEIFACMSKSNHVCLCVC